VELLLKEWLRQACGDKPDAWLEHLKPAQRGIIERYWRDAIERDLAIDRLALASFGHEIRAAAGLGLFDGHEQVQLEIEGLKRLRDLVCHAAEFAPTPEQALRIPPLAGGTQALATWLIEKILKSKA
jgi:hypothetical protein